LKRAGSMRPGPTPGLRVCDSLVEARDTQHTQGSRQYCPQYHRVSGLCPTSGIPNTRKHSFSETGPVSVLSEGRETPTLLGPLKRASLNYWTRLPPHA
jgi:hypothetical protein